MRFPWLQVDADVIDAKAGCDPKCVAAPKGGG